MIVSSPIAIFVIIYGLFEKIYVGFSSFVYIGTLLVNITYIISSQSRFEFS